MSSLKKELPESGCIGFDGRVVNGSWGRKLLAIAGEKEGVFVRDGGSDRSDLEGSPGAF